MIKRIVYAVAIAAIGITIVNDLGRWIITKYNLVEATNEAARIAARAGDEASAWGSSSNHASSEGVTIYGFEWTSESASVWTEAPVYGTWALGSLMVVFEGRPLTSDWVIRDEAVENR
ncbi:MAG: hypothetical protein OEV43_00910 [Coriobacteriia bacterium]|nr:hypothetical protein [Coriobacteriia bacterium]